MMARTRQLTLIVSVALRLFIEDPFSFLTKAHQRSLDTKLLPTKVIGWALEYVSAKNQTAIREHYEVGNYRAALDLASTMGDQLSRSDLRLVGLMKGELERLYSPIVDSPIEKAKLGGFNNKEVRPLFFLTNSLPHTQSGYTLRSHESLKALKSLGLEASAITRLGYPNVIGRLASGATEEFDGIVYSRALPFYYPRLLSERDDKSADFLVKEARRCGATILHTTTDYKNAMVVSKAAEKLQVPWVYEVRGELHKTWLSKRPTQLKDAAANSDFYQGAAKKEIEAMKSASAVVALSEVAQRNIVDAGVPPEKIHVVPNAVDSGLFRKRFDRGLIRKQLHLPCGPIVGIVSSLVEYEGIDTLLCAIAREPGYVGLIVGDGVDRERLENLAREYEIEDRVIFAGKQPSTEVWRWYAALDVMVIPRRDEEVCRTVTPIKGLAAQALGVPLVVSDLPALREITGEKAFYARPDDVDDLLKQIRKGLEATDQHLGEAREWARTRTWKANAAKYMNIYDLILNA